MPLNVSQHPLVAHKLAILRDKRTEPKEFRELVRELTWLLGYEAMADLATRQQQIETPLASMTAACLEPRVGLIPILRAGLGMLGAMLELLPTAEVWHLGLYRDERTLKPVEYYNKLPDAATVQVCLVLDTMLATGARRQPRSTSSRSGAQPASSRSRSLPPPRASPRSAVLTRTSISTSRRSIRT